jgi:hypothetical protein
MIVDLINIVPTLERCSSFKILFFLDGNKKAGCLGVTVRGRALQSGCRIDSIASHEAIIT